MGLSSKNNELLTKSEGKMSANRSTTWLRFASGCKRLVESCLIATINEAAVMRLGGSSTKKHSVAHNVISFSVINLRAIMLLSYL
jgi:hypothetical protein